MSELEVIPVADLQGAIETLSMLVSLVRQVQASGVAPSVEELTLSMLTHPDPHREARHALPFAVA